jgi:hypothetical protein
MNERLQQLITVAQTGARDIGEHMSAPDEDWRAMAFLDHGDETRFYECAEAMVSVGAKNTLAQFLRREVAENHSTAFVMLNSVWMVKPPQGMPLEEATAGPRPSEHPDRIEALIVVGYTREEVYAYEALITRHEDEPPTLGPWTEWKDADVAGRFVDDIREALS